jgi:hypothetical protein
MGISKANSWLASSASDFTGKYQARIACGTGRLSESRIEQGRGWIACPAVVPPEARRLIVQWGEQAIRATQELIANREVLADLRGHV